MYIFVKFAKIDSRAVGGWTELLLCLVTDEEKLLKGNNSTCSLTDFSFQMINCISLGNQYNSVMNFISRILCDYRKFEQIDFMLIYLNPY